MESPEESDTVPNSPIGIAQDFDHDFARLIPSNDAARVAFHALAELTQIDGSRMPHARKFIHIHSNQVALSPDTNTDTDTSEPDRRPLLHHGYYRFNLDILPKEPLEGWRIGRGRDDQRNEDVDLRLSITSGNGVRSQHARVTYDFKTNILLISAPKGRKVIINGKNELNGSLRVLGDPITSIDIGNLRYSFEYTVQGGGAYRRKLIELREQLGLPSTTATPLSLSPTPSRHDYEFHEYFMKPAFEAGSTCTVLTGVHKTTGALVAVKRMTRNRKNASHISHEIDILQEIQKHKPHVSLADH
jgi:hypothetical protein